LSSNEKRDDDIRENHDVAKGQHRDARFGLDFLAVAREFLGHVFWVRIPGTG
jgi:hypothetical protein